jgi:hypothetical protein
MSSIQVKAIGSQLRGLMSTVARQIASAIEGSAGRTTLPTKAQLMKMGPQTGFQRVSQQRHDW